MRDSLSAFVPPRSHLLFLAFLLLVGAMRGGYWVLTTEIWNPVDEAQHYAYAESLARGHGIPVVGADEVSLDVLGIAKASPTLPFLSRSPQVSENANWGTFGEQYEGGGVQGPVYYSILVVPYWIASPFSNITSVYALRFTSLLVALTAIPLTWLLARELFPRLPAVWLASPMLVVFIQGYNANPASLSNDALVIPLSAAALIPVAGAWQGLHQRQAAVAGVLFGLALLTKMSMLPLGVMTGGMLFTMLILGRASLREVLTWGVIYSVIALSVLAPYLAWNLAHYGSISAGGEVEAITGRFQQEIPITFQGLRAHFERANTGFWELQTRTLGPDSAYVWFFQRASLVSIAGGAALLAARRQFMDALKLSWIGLAFLVAFATLLGASLMLFDEKGGVIGRHLYVAFAPLTIALAAGLVTMLGSRAGVLAVALVIGVGLIHERDLSHHYVQAAYASGVLDGRLAPVTEQPFNENIVTPSTVDVSPICPVEAIGLVFRDPPDSLTVSGTVSGEALKRDPTGAFSVYTLPSVTAGQFSIVTRGLPLARSSLDRTEVLSMTGVSGDPVARLYCAVDDPSASRFSQMWNPGHIGGVGYGEVRAWSTAWYWAGWVIVGSALLGILGLSIYAVVSRGKSSPIA